MNMEMNGLPFARCSQTTDVNKNRVRLVSNPQFGNSAQVSLKANDVFQRSNHGASSVRFGGKDPEEEQVAKEMQQGMYRIAATQEHAEKMGDKEYTHEEKVAKWKQQKRAFNTKKGLTPSQSGLDPSTESDGE